MRKSAFGELPVYSAVKVVASLVMTLTSLSFQSSASVEDCAKYVVFGSRAASVPLVKDMVRLPEALIVGDGNALKEKGSSPRANSRRF